MFSAILFILNKFLVVLVSADNSDLWKKFDKTENRSNEWFFHIFFFFCSGELNLLALGLSECHTLKWNCVSKKNIQCVVLKTNATVNHRQYSVCADKKSHALKFICQKKDQQIQHHKWKELQWSNGKQHVHVQNGREENTMQPSSNHIYANLVKRLPNKPCESYWHSKLNATERCSTTKRTDQSSNTHPQQQKYHCKATKCSTNFQMLNFI